ncbi:TetR/AcrR family transcriptional regulator [Paenibacillus sp. J5C_2022]|uniref:TetR/AcrR family transcriptional regulator n=1 Tax=Paenibacillus sp. J5C2022 TaxID=2977129 RepID=UPI0021CE9706|nr:TetR/AcrR family transcriptional regulator [Paenibacillus sp. J5C2022]MCU6711111.1 TetR/AcrR family transcriptional regulator [Paenibacillus sp. J5C2022]
MSARRSKKRELIVQHALIEFSEKSYEEASINQIIHQSQSSKGAFYHHFNDKLVLYLTVLKEAAEAKRAYVESRLTEAAHDIGKMDIFESFKLQAKLGFDFATDHPVYDRLIRMLMKEKSEAAVQAVRQKLQVDLNVQLNAMIQDGIDRGELRSDLPQDFLVRVISYMLAGFNNLFVPGEEQDKDEVMSNLDRYIDLLNETFRASPSLDT